MKNDDLKDKSGQLKKYAQIWWVTFVGLVHAHDGWTVKKRSWLSSYWNKDTFFLSVNKTMEYNDDGIELNHSNKEYS